MALIKRGGYFMKLSSVVKYVDRSTNDYKGKTYYNLLLVQGTEAIPKIGCDQKVYDRLGALKELQSFTGTFEYNPQYGRMDLLDFEIPKN